MYDLTCLCMVLPFSLISYICISITKLFITQLHFSSLLRMILHCYAWYYLLLALYLIFAYNTLFFLVTHLSTVIWINYKRNTETELANVRFRSSDFRATNSVIRYSSHSFCTINCHRLSEFLYHKDTKVFKFLWYTVLTYQVFLILFELQLPVSTRRHFDVVITLLSSKQRCINVKTTFCVYWDVGCLQKIFKTHANVIFGIFQFNNPNEFV